MKILTENSTSSVADRRSPTKSGRPSKDRGAAVREKILEVAATLFSTKGYAESGIREIADMAGIRSSTVYYHFPSKEHVYEEIIRLAVDLIHGAVSDAVKALGPEATPRDCIEAAIAAHLTALHTNKPYTSTNAQSRIRLPDEANRSVQAIRKEYSDYWRILIKDAEDAGWLKPDVDARMLRSLIIGTLNLTIGWFDGKRGSLERLIANTVVVFSGIWAETHKP